MYFVNNDLTKSYKAEIMYRKEYKTREKSMEYLAGIITDLFVDWNRLSGSDVKSKIPNLQSIIMSGNFDDLLKAFVGNRK